MLLHPLNRARARLHFNLRISINPSRALFSGNIRGMIDGGPPGHTLAIPTYHRHNMPFFIIPFSWAHYAACSPPHGCASEALEMLRTANGASLPDPVSEL